MGTTYAAHTSRLPCKHFFGHELEDEGISLPRADVCFLHKEAVMYSSPMQHMSDRAVKQPAASSASAVQVLRTLCKFAGKHIVDGNLLRSPDHSPCTADAQAEPQWASGNPNGPACFCAIAELL